jgi:hypothetical protein
MSTASSARSRPEPARIRSSSPGPRRLRLGPRPLAWPAGSSRTRPVQAGDHHCGNPADQPDRGKGRLGGPPAQSLRRVRQRRPRSSRLSQASGSGVSSNVTTLVRSRVAAAESSPIRRASWPRSTPDCPIRRCSSSATSRARALQQALEQRSGGRFPPLLMAARGARDDHGLSEPAWPSVRRARHAACPGGGVGTSWVLPDGMPVPKLARRTASTSLNAKGSKPCPTPDRTTPRTATRTGAKITPIPRD